MSFAPCPLPLPEILKSHPATQLAIEDYYRSNFWEFRQREPHKKNPGLLLMTYHLAPCSLFPPEILTSLLATQLTQYNDNTADFWESLPTRPPKWADGESGKRQPVTQLTLHTHTQLTLQSHGRTVAEGLLPQRCRVPPTISRDWFFWFLAKLEKLAWASPSRFLLDFFSTTHNQPRPIQTFDLKSIFGPHHTFLGQKLG